MAILSFLLLTAICIVRMHDLFATVILMSAYGLLSASFFVMMDAVDVALTEAAVGIVISPLLLLSTLSLTVRYEKRALRKPILASVLVVLTGALLVYGTLDMPPFGSVNTPAHQHVAAYYVEHSYRETGVANLVSSVLASYRAYDTFGELIVIFTAGVGVLAVLGVHTRVTKKIQSGKLVPLTMSRHHILRIVSKMLIPLMLLFALYIQFHGDFGPGGGFQAGAIFASALILYTLLFGLQAALRVVNRDWLEFFAAFGLLLYGGTGLVSLAMGEAFLDYHVLADSATEAQHLGILAVELGVGITVASVILLIFLAFTAQMARIGSIRGPDS